MNRILNLACLWGFFLLPVILLTTRAVRPKAMPWRAILVLVPVLGWALANGAVHFYYKHLGELVRSHEGNVPPDLLRKFTSDGAKLVFALFFGWLYALVYFAPFALIYGAIQFFRRHQAGPTP